MLDARRPIDCPEGQSECSGVCVDLQSTASNCGRCGNACTTGMACERGTCVMGCMAGTMLCAGGCVDVSSNPQHCGGCGMACATGEMCTEGRCGCPMAGTRCGDACVDLRSDPRNCGTCGTACAADEACREGRCGCAGGDAERACDDTMDDDCDGRIDCNDDECLGATRRCEDAGRPGVETCEAGGRWSACQTGGSGMTEICGDGIDQDGDGEDLRRPDSQEPNDSCGACRRITMGAPDIDVVIEATIDSVDDPMDCYVFATDDGTFELNETIDVSLTSVPSTADYDVYLYYGLADCMSGTSRASSSTGLAGEDDGFSWTERFGTEDGGDYYLVVRRFSGQSCDDTYLLSIRGLGAP